MIVKKNRFQDVKSTYSRAMLLGLVRSMVNQHCFPNTIFSSGDRKEVCTTLRPVKKDDQLCVAFCKWPGSNSRQQIYDEYGYWCECSKCVPTPMFLYYQLRLEADIQFQQIRALGGTAELNDIFENRAHRAIIRDRCQELLSKHDCPHYTEAYELLMRIFESFVQADYSDRNPFL